MPVSIDRQSAAPIYHQLYLSLRDSVLAGVYPSSSALPSERDLTTQFGVSRITARHAIQQLERDGYVVRRHGSGTFVTPNPPPVPIHADMQAVIENVAAFGAETQGRLIEVGNVLPNAAVRGALRLRRKEMAHKVVHSRSSKGHIIGVFETHVPIRIGNLLGHQEIEAKPMLVLLGEVGVTVAWASQSLGAVPADIAIAQQLEIAPGGPLVRLERTVYDHDDHPVEHLVALYRGDRYVYRTILRREGGWIR